MLNRVELIGTLTRDPELKALESGAFVCQFTLAFDDTAWDHEARQKKVVTSYISCNAWNEQAEFAAEQFGTGDVIYVMGQVVQQEVPRKDGTKEKKTRVRADWMRGVRKANRARQGGYGDAAEVPSF